MSFPRRKWIGSDESLDDCGWLVVCHGVLLTLFEEATSASFVPVARPPPARGPRPRQAARAAAPRVRVSIGEAQSPAARLQRPGGNHHQPDCAMPPPAMFLVPDTEFEPDTREANEVKRQGAADFLADEPLAHIVLLRIVVEPFRTMKARLLECGSAAWRERQLITTSGQRTHPLTRSWQADEAEDALADLTKLMRSQRAWRALGEAKLRDGSWALTALRLLARAGAGIKELLVSEQRVYPYKLFAILGQPDLADEVAADFAERPCMFDPVSASLCTDHPSASELRGPAAQSKIMSIAELVQTSTAKVECGHAAVRRRARSQVQTHAPSLAVQSAYRAVARGRRLVSEAWPTRCGLQRKPGQSASQPGRPAQEAQRVQPRGLKHAAPSGNDGIAGPGCKRPCRPGAGGAWRVHVREEKAKAPGTTFQMAAVSYRALSAPERARLQRIGRMFTAARRNGVARTVRKRQNNASNREWKALGRRKHKCRLANGTWDRNAQLTAVRAEFDDRNNLVGDALAEDRRNTKTALRAHQALLQGLRRHANSMASASEPGLCPSDDVFDKTGGQLVAAGGLDLNKGEDSGSDSSAGGRAQQPVAADACPMSQSAACAPRQLRSLWHLPRRLESVEAAVSAMGIGPGSRLIARGVDWEARHTVITGAECRKIGRLPPQSLCQRAGRCICRGPGRCRAVLYSRIQAALTTFVRPAGPPDYMRCLLFVLAAGSFATHSCGSWEHVFG